MMLVINYVRDAASFIISFPVVFLLFSYSCNDGVLVIKL